ncbi:MAG: hypothetical protein QOE55_3869 [Acidobacteriaceae bacterium]|nr:hypothetical protein [Acidobacteriaceae bacterium]
MKAFGVAARKWRVVLLSMGVLSTGWMLSSRADAQAGPPAQTIPEAPTLQNESLKPLDYRNKFDIYGGLASSHFNAGPALIPGANLGGFDVQGTMWFGMRLGATANVRGYYGTTGVVPNPYGIHGPLIMEHLFMGGPSIRGPKNEHAALTFHALVGGSYGIFDSAIDQGLTGPNLGLFSNGVALATALGGSLDLNRSPRYSVRISPDYLLTRFGGVSQNEFAISVGLLYRFSKMRKH